MVDSLHAHELLQSLLHARAGVGYSDVNITEPIDVKHLQEFRHVAVKSSVLFLIK